MLTGLVANRANEPQCAIDSKSLEVVVSNDAARSQYKCWLLTERRTMHVSNIFATFKWETPQQTDEAMVQLKHLNPDCAPIEMELQRAGGGSQQAWKRLVWSTAEGPTEGTFYLILTEHDITDVVNAREKQVTLRLASALRAKNEFLEAVCYELRTPLHSIMSLSQMCAPQDSATERVVSAIETSAIRLNSVVDDILLFASVDSVPQAFQVLPLRSLVQCVCETLRSQLRGDVQLRNDIHQSTVVFGHLASIKQILLKTVGNLETASSGVVRFLAVEQENTDTVLLLIADGTNTIPIKTYASVWDAQEDASFRRVGSSGSVDACCGHGGLGLRLSLVRQLVQAQGGKVEVVNAKGQDTIHFTLPRTGPKEVVKQGMPVAEHFEAWGRTTSAGAAGFKLEDPGRPVDQGHEKECALRSVGGGRRGDRNEAEGEVAAAEEEKEEKEEALKLMEETVRKQQVASPASSKQPLVLTQAVRCQAEIRRLREQVGKLQKEGGGGGKLERTSSVASEANTQCASSSVYPPKKSFPLARERECNHVVCTGVVASGTELLVACLISEWIAPTRCVVLTAGFATSRRHGSSSPPGSFGSFPDWHVRSCVCDPRSRAVRSKPRAVHVLL